MLKKVMIINSLILEASFLPFSSFLNITNQVRQLLLTRIRGIIIAPAQKLWGWHMALGFRVENAKARENDCWVLVMRWQEEQQGRQWWWGWERQWHMRSCPHATNQLKCLAIKRGEVSRFSKRLHAPSPVIHLLLARSLTRSERSRATCFVCFSDRSRLQL